jgi:hypothetical protein
MLHLLGEFEEWQLAELARRDIPFYVKAGEDVCFVPYIDDLDGRKRKYIKFQLLAGQWVYVDNNQNG